MGYNVLSGNVLLPGQLLADGQVSSSAFVGDGKELQHVLKITSNPDQYNLTTIGSDAYKLTGQSNLTFNGTKLSVTGEVSASTGISASAFYGDGSKLSGISGGGIFTETATNSAFTTSSIAISGSFSVSGSENMPALFVTGAKISTHGYAQVGINNDEPFGQLSVTAPGSRAQLYLQRSGSSFLSDGDDIGEIRFQGQNPDWRGAHYSALIRAEADGSEHNSDSLPGRLSFWTTLTGARWPTQRMTINNSGNVGIGTTTIDHTLTVAGDISASVNISASAFYGDGSKLTGISADGGGGIFTELSNNLAATTSSIAIGGATAPDHAIALSGAMSASLNVSASGFVGNRLYISGAVVYHHRTSTSTITASVDDYYIGMDSNSAAIELRLPDAAVLIDGHTYIVKDEGGNAATNNITILASGSQTIDGENSLILESPYASFSLYCNGVNKYYVY